MTWSRLLPVAGSYVMESFFLEHQNELRTALLLGGLLFVALWESFAPTRRLATNTAIRWIYNIGLLAIDNVLLRLVFPMLAIGLSLIASDRGWGLLNQVALPGYADLLIVFVVLDFINYVQHWSLHKVPLLWRLHKVHHSDIDYDCTTGFRFHPLESIFTTGVQLTIIVTMGVPPIVIISYELVFVMTALLNHGNISLPQGLDRYLRLVFVTPDMHRVHHSANTREGNSNFAGIFSFWDRLFGTYCARPAAGQRGMMTGLAEFRNPGRLHFHHLLLLPFRRSGESEPLESAPRPEESVQSQ